MKKPLGHFTDEPSGPLLITRNDLQILQLFNTYRLLPRNWIVPFVDAHPNYVRIRLGRLARRPHKLLGYHVYGGRNVNGIRHYFRTDAGDRFLASKGLPAETHYQPSPNAHQSHTDIVHASIELGARDKLRLTKWPDLLAKRPKLQQSNYPLRMYVGGEYATADGNPFALSNDKGGTLFFTEVDRDTEAISRSKTKRATIIRKIEHYRDYWKNEKYKDHFDVKSALIAWYCPSEGRKQSIMKAVHDIIGPCTYMLFQTFEDFTILGTTPPFTTKFFDDPYERVSMPPYYLSTLSDKSPKASGV